MDKSPIRRPSEGNTGENGNPVAPVSGSPGGTPVQSEDWGTLPSGEIKSQFSAVLAAESSAEIWTHRLLQKIVGNIKTYGNLNLAAHLARLHVTDAMQVILELMGDANCPESVRLNAAKEILNRGYGMPVMSILPDTSEQAPDEAISGISQHIDLMMESQKYVGRLPPEQWPERVRQFLGVTRVETLEAEIKNPPIDVAVTSGTADPSPNQ